MRFQYAVVYSEPFAGQDDLIYNGSSLHKATEAGQPGTVWARDSTRTGALLKARRYAATYRAAKERATRPGKPAGATYTNGQVDLSLAPEIAEAARRVREAAFSQRRYAWDVLDYMERRVS